MNFNYSYRAFLITSLIFGIVFIAFWSIKLSSNIPENVDHTPIEYIEPEIEKVSDDKLAIAASQNTTKVETNKAYNEAKKFIEELENETNNTNDLHNSSSQPLENEYASDTSGELAKNAIEVAQKKLALLKKMSTEKATKIPEKNSNNSSKKTTISYYLENRNALKLPNPVYTCDAGGKVVVDVVVNEGGRVVKATINKKTTTTTNGCLLDSAIMYANQSLFTVTSTNTAQTGTITYMFPGQL